MAVYTEVDDQDLAGFLEDYDLGTVQAFKGIAEGVENSNYVLETTAGRYILTLYERRVNTADLPFFLGLLDHVATRGVRVPQPVHRRDGAVLGTLKERAAALVTFLPGISISRPTPTHCHAVGEALAHLHAAAGDFGLNRANSLGPRDWLPMLQTCTDEADTLREGLYHELATMVTDTVAAWPTGLPEGIIHADLFPDNVFFQGALVSGLIDPYFACHDLLAYDIAVCLNAWCFERDGAFNVTRARHLLRGYSGVRSLDEAEREALPVLCTGAALRFTLTRLHDWFHGARGPFVRPKDPLEFLAYARFHASAQGPGDYGL